MTIFYHLIIKQKTTLCPQCAFEPYELIFPAIVMCVSSNYETHFEGSAGRCFSSMIIQTN
jgi:hypothetical protein